MVFKALLLNIWALKIIAVVCIVSLLIPNMIYAADDGGGAALQFVPFQGSLVITYFENPSGAEDLEILREELPRQLIDELSGRERVRVVSWEDTLGAMEGLGSDSKEVVNKGKGLALAEFLEADAVLLGGFLPLGSGIRVFVQIYEVGSGRLLAEVEAGGPEEKSPVETAMDLASLLEARLLQPGAEITTPEIGLYPLLGVLISILNPGSGQYYVRKPWDGLFYYLAGTFVLANLVLYWGDYQIRPSSGLKANVESWLWGLIWLTVLATFDAYTETNLYNYNVQKYRPKKESPVEKETSEQPDEQGSGSGLQESEVDRQ